MNNRYRTLGYVASRLRCFLQGGKGMLRVEVQDFRDLMARKAIPQVIAFQHARDNLKRQGCLADVCRANKECETTWKEPGIKEVS